GLERLNLLAEDEPAALHHIATGPRQFIGERSRVSFQILNRQLHRKPVGHLTGKRKRATASRGDPADQRNSRCWCQPLSWTLARASPCSTRCPVRRPGSE